VAVGGLAGAATIVAITSVRGTTEPWAPPRHAVLTAAAAALAATAATLLVAAALHGDGWGILAVVMLTFGLHDLWLSTRLGA
jgi:hypothetical protein